jgi:GAF domain-containing protein
MLGGADPSTSDPRDRDQTSVRDGVQRLAQLQQVTARLATALTVEEVSEILLELSERVLGASATVVYVDDGRGQFRLAGMRGIPQLDDRLMVLPLDAALPLVDAIRGVTPLWIENRELLLAHYPHVVNSSLPSDRLQSVVALPLVHGDRVAGGLALSFDRPQQFEAEDRRWLESLAAQSALAAERARLYAAERRARPRLCCASPSR